MDSYGDPQQRDLHVGVLIIGSATALGLFCLYIVLSSLLYAGRLDLISRVILPVLLPVLALLVLGYVMGRSAIREKVTPNLHVVVLGYFLMHVHTLILFLQYIMSPDEVMDTIRYSILLTLFIIPLMLLGCAVARRNEEPRASANRVR